MFETLKQSVFTSIALAGMTRDRIAEVVSEIAKQADLNEQQAQEFEQELSQRSDQARKALNQQIDHQIDHALIQLGLMKSEARKSTEAVIGTLRAIIDERIDDACGRLKLARLEDIEALIGRIELLERKLSG